MNEFIGYSVGLEANGHDLFGKLVRAEYNRSADGSVVIQAVNGRTLAKLPGTKTVRAEAFEDRPSENIAQARWALSHCGWTLMGDDE